MAIVLEDAAAADPVAAAVAALVEAARASAEAYTPGDLAAMLRDALGLSEDGGAGTAEERASKKEEEAAAHRANAERAAARGSSESVVRFYQRKAAMARGEANRLRAS